MALSTNTIIQKPKVIFTTPQEVIAQVQAQALASAKAKAQAKAKADALAKEKADALAKTKADALALAKAKADAIAKEKADAEALVKAEAKAKLDAIAKAKADADALVKAEAQAKLDAIEKAKADAEAIVKAEADADALTKIEEDKLNLAKAIALANLAQQNVLDCEAKANVQMSTMRFASAQDASNYKTSLINKCNGTTEIATSIIPTPMPSVEVLPKVETPIIPTITTDPLQTGVSAIVEPNLGIPTTSIDTVVDSNTSSAVNPNETIIEGNVLNKDLIDMTKEPNYILYAGVIISVLVIYNLLKKE